MTRRRDPFAAVAALVAVVPFLPALRNGFVWDDGLYVGANPVLRAGWPSVVPAAFGALTVGNWHPVTLLSLALDNAIGGPGPFVFHVTNLLLHGVNAALAYRLAARLGGHRSAAVCATLLWAVHPLRVESVAWIAERKDLLYVAFFLLALLAYVRHVEGGGRIGRAYAVALGLFAASALSKAMAVSLVPVLFLTDWYLGRGLDRRSLAEKIPFALGGLSVGSVAIVVQHSAGALPELAGLGVASRLAYACYGIVHYALTTVAPRGLAGMYRYPTAPAGGIPTAVWGSVVAAAVLGALAVWAGRRSRVAAYGLGFAVTTIARVLQILPVGDAVAADRYTYLPSIGLATALAAAIAWALARWPRMASATVAAAVLALATGSWIRCGAWRDEMTFWTDVLAKDPSVTIAHQNLGVALDDRGDPAGALFHFDAAIRLNPRFAEAWWARANVRAAHGNLPGALDDYAEAVRLDPAVPKYWLNRALALGDAGRWDDTLAALTEAIRLDPQFAEAYLNRGLALEQMGRAAEGLPDVLRASYLGYPVEPAVLARFNAARDGAQGSSAR